MYIWNYVHRRQNTGSVTEPTQVCSNNSDESKTIYKTVDFAKTNALNRTKRDIESEREQAISDHSHQFSPSGVGIAGAVGTNLLINRWVNEETVICDIYIANIDLNVKYWRGKNTLVLHPMLLNMIHIKYCECDHCNFCGYGYYLPLATISVFETSSYDTILHPIIESCDC